MQVIGDCSGAEQVHWCRVAELQRREEVQNRGCRAHAEVQMKQETAEVLRCICAEEVQKHSMVQRCRGEEVQRQWGLVGGAEAQQR